jgi:predicted dehydrogenase
VRVITASAAFGECRIADFWRTNPVDAGGGLFVDLGLHTLDLLDHPFAARRVAWPVR